MRLPVALGLNVMLNVQLAPAAIFDGQSFVSVKSCQLTRRAIDPAEHRLWRAARVGQRDGFRGARRVNHLIAERDSTRADREGKGFAWNGDDYNRHSVGPPRIDGRCGYDHHSRRIGDGRRRGVFSGGVNGSAACTRAARTGDAPGKALAAGQADT